jgi:tetratricopeptide (TPR) repeat protein
MNKYLLIGAVVASYGGLFYFKQKKQDRIDKLHMVLYAEKNVDKYLDEVEKELSKSKSGKSRDINLLQKTTGLFFKGRFDEAIKIMNEDIKNIPPSWQHIYYHNLALCYYFSGNIEKGNETIDIARGAFSKKSTSEHKTATIEFLYSVYDYYSGKGAARKTQFKDAFQSAPNEYRKALGYYFSGKIYQEEQNFQQSKVCFEKSKQYGKGSFLEKLKS